MELNESICLSGAYDSIPLNARGDTMQAAICITLHNSMIAFWKSSIKGHKISEDLIKEVAS